MKLLAFVLAGFATGCPGDKGTTDDSGDHPADADGDTWAADRDCDDDDASVNPDAPELCNGKDDDCDGTTDEDDAEDGATFYADSDGDGYGGTSGTTTACEAPAGYAATSDDCNDDSSAVNPGAAELCDGADNDCDGETDEEATDGTIYYEDADGDRYGGVEVALCEREPGYALEGGDCDDANADANPGETEVCDGADNDCDGEIDDGATDLSAWYTDADADGYGDDLTVVYACEGTPDQVEQGGDCDEADPDVNPGVDEPCEDTDGIDNDCDGRTDPTTCPSNEGYTVYQLGEGRDPDDRDCVQWWYTEWSPTTSSTCVDCLWTADVEFTLDTTLSYDGGGCYIEDLGYYVESFGLIEDYYGYGDFLAYYGPYSYGEWYPIFYADWDASAQHLTFWYGYYEYWEGRSYYTNYWSGYAYVDI